MAVHTMTDLYQMQSLPLELKVRMTETRIKAWVNEYGEDGVYISFSGGKDSTVLMNIIRNEMGYTDIPAVFVDVPTQYPELKEFATSFDNVEVIRPKISFMEVCERYGFPLISKEVSGSVSESRKYLTELERRIASATDRQTDRQTQIPGSWAIADLLGIERRRKTAQTKRQMENLKMGIIPNGYFETLPVRMRIVLGKLRHKENGVVTDEYSSQYNKTKYLFYLDSPFEISDKCCKVMKKAPLHELHRKRGWKPITAQMADESKLRQSQWMKNGCNGFQMKSPVSNPMSFWTEQDVLKYIKEKNLPICSVYGDVVEDYEAEGLMDGQITFDEFNADKVYKTTGCKRTGCMLCGFGCHMKDDNRFLLLKETHPKMYGLLDVVKNNGYTFREAIEWTNEHGNLDIRL